MNKIRKAVIPTAGLGTRFLPITKAVPKSMLPIVDTPTIDYIVDEAVAAGIEDIIIITSHNTDVIERHFSENKELEERLLSDGKKELYRVLKHITARAKVTFVKQTVLNGLAGALSARKNCSRASRSRFCSGTRSFIRIRRKNPASDSSARRMKRREERFFPPCGWQTGTCANTAISA